MNREYEKTKQEINILCEYLILNDKPEVNIIEDNNTNLVLLKILKSNVLMMLYNIIEATVRNCIEKYYDKYNESEKSYSEASTEIKKLWLSYNNFSEHGFNEELFNLINSTFSTNGLTLDINKFSLSGNADVREIKRILDKHAIEYDDSKFTVYGEVMCTVKRSRNLLAHGNISFAEATKDLTTEDIVNRYKTDVFKCLDYVVEVVNTEILRLDNSNH